MSLYSSLLQLSSICSQINKLPFSFYTIKSYVPGNVVRILGIWERKTLPDIQTINKIKTVLSCNSTELLVKYQTIIQSLEEGSFTQHPKLAAEERETDRGFMYQEEVLSRSQDGVGGRLFYKYFYSFFMCAEQCMNHWVTPIY